MKKKVSFILMIFLVYLCYANKYTYENSYSSVLTIEMDDTTNFGNNYFLGSNSEIIIDFKTSEITGDNIRGYVKYFLKINNEIYKTDQKLKLSPNEKTIIELYYVFQTGWYATNIPQNNKPEKVYIIYPAGNNYDNTFTIENCTVTLPAHYWKHIKWNIIH